MVRRNATFEVEEIEQLALVDLLLTHHDPPPPRTSGRRNHDSPITTRTFSTASVNRVDFAMCAVLSANPNSGHFSRWAGTPLSDPVRAGAGDTGGPSLHLPRDDRPAARWVFDFDQYLAPAL